LLIVFHQFLSIIFQKTTFPQISNLDVHCPEASEEALANAFMRFQIQIPISLQIQHEIDCMRAVRRINDEQAGERFKRTQEQHMESMVLHEHVLQEEFAAATEFQFKCHVEDVTSLARDVYKCIETSRTDTIKELEKFEIEFRAYNGPESVCETKNYPYRCRNDLKCHENYFFRLGHFFSKKWRGHNFGFQKT